VLAPPRDLNPDRPWSSPVGSVARFGARNPGGGASPPAGTLAADGCVGDGRYGSRLSSGASNEASAPSIRGDWLEVRDASGHDRDRRRRSRIHAPEREREGRGPVCCVRASDVDGVAVDPCLGSQRLDGAASDRLDRDLHENDRASRSGTPVRLGRYRPPLRNLNPPSRYPRPRVRFSAARLLPGGLPPPLQRARPSLRLGN
jgi:hypothetical protein